MARMKAYTKEEIAFASAIYIWLNANSEIGKTGRYRKEVISRLSVENIERFDRAIEYLKEIKLMVSNHSGYMLIRKSASSDFPTQGQQTTTERLYGKPFA